MTEKRFNRSDQNKDMGVSCSGRKSLRQPLLVEENVCKGRDVLVRLKKSN